LERPVADLEQRVATLEREMVTVKDRVGLVEEDAKSIPDLIKLEFRLANSRWARSASDIVELQRNVGELQRKVEAMPKAVAELVVELLAERDRRR
jgi:hypothetical protein